MPNATGSSKTASRNRHALVPTGFVIESRRPRRTEFTRDGAAAFGPLKLHQVEEVPKAAEPARRDTREATRDLFG